MTHPLRRALIVRMAYNPDCTDDERDRIMRTCFTGVDTAAIREGLDAIRDAHRRRDNLACSDLVDQLVELTVT